MSWLSRNSYSARHRPMRTRYSVRPFSFLTSAIAPAPNARTAAKITRRSDSVRRDKSRSARLVNWICQLTSCRGAARSLRSKSSVPIDRFRRAPSVHHSRRGPLPLIVFGRRGDHVFARLRPARPNAPPRSPGFRRLTGARQYDPCLYFTTLAAKVLRSDLSDPESVAHIRIPFGKPDFTIRPGCDFTRLRVSIRKWVLGK